MLVSGPTGVGKSTLLGVRHRAGARGSPGGELRGDVLLDGVEHPAHAAARAGARRSGTSGRTRSPASSPTPSRRSWPTAWSSSGCRRRRCAAGSRRRSTCSASPTCASRDLRTLSGGQQQRVAIGSVLTMHPRLLVLDEPTSALDPTAAEEVLATLTRLVHDLGVSVLLAEHRLERVVPFADRMCLVPATAGHRGRARRRAGHLAGGAADRRARPGRRLAPAAAHRPRRPPPGRGRSTWRPRHRTAMTAPTRRRRSPAAG